MKKLLVLNPEKVSEEEVKYYSIREATRAIVVDKDGKVALSHVSKLNYYKLPGGGIKKNEDRIEALKRECREEIGSEIEVTTEIGSIVEYRKTFKLKQISYCYLSKLKGTKGKSKFTSKEAKEGFEPVWLFYEEARRVVAESSATDFERRTYIIPRDIAFLEEAKNYLIK